MNISGVAGAPDGAAYFTGSIFDAILSVAVCACLVWIIVRIYRDRSGR